MFLTFDIIIAFLWHSQLYTPFKQTYVYQYVTGNEVFTDLTHRDISVWGKSERRDLKQTEYYIHHPTVINTKYKYFYAPTMKNRGGGNINLPLSVRPFVRPDIDTWFVRLSPPTVLELHL
jgi:hypothetical protein